MTERESDRPVLALLDGHSMAYRAFYALPESLATRTGQQTNAVYGFTSMLIKLLSDRKPDAVAVCFDQGRDVRRTERYPEYKAGRITTPDEFRSQLTLIDDVLDVLEVPMIRVPGVEADDVIATIAERAVAAGHDVLIVTGDRDAMQLASDHVTVLYTLRGISEVGEMTPAAVEEKYGVPPSKYVEYAALRGDKSDNLPGVPKIGEKTASKLIQDFGGIDGIYDNLDKIRGKVVPANLVEFREQVETNLFMMLLRRDVEVEVSLEDLRIGSIQNATVDTAKIREVFGALEFRALYDRFVEEVLGDVEEEQATGYDKEPVNLVGSGLGEWLDAIEGPLAVVPFTSGKVPHVTWEAVGLAAPDREPAYARLDAADPISLDVLAGVLADAALPKVVHSLKQLHHAATGRGWTLDGIDVDTELAAYLLNPEQRSFDLERIALQYLARTLTTESAAAAAAAKAADTGDGQMSFGLDEPAEPAVEEDPFEERALRAAATRELGVELGAQVLAREQRDLYDLIELPLAPVLARMEHVGIAVDLHVLGEIDERLSARADDLEREVWDHAGREFKIGSGKQLQEVLFVELELPKTKKIKTGWSTDATQMANIADAHPIVTAVLEWREVTKLLSTYVTALPKLVDAETGRIHTTLSQTVAATGRLSSSDPNLQNIPVRRAEGREIRKAFVPGEGFDQLFVADYSQIELRVMAHLSRDEGLLEAFLGGEDIHVTTAAKVWDLEPSEVDGALRDRAKAINYGLAYGLTPFGLSQQIGIPPSEAAEIVDAYMLRFPGIKRFLDLAVVDATRAGWTTTMFGRRRYLPDLMSDNRNRRQMAERMALNAPIQGTAADIIKLAMIAVQDAVDQAGLRSQLILQVHDEVILECPDDELDAVTEIVSAAMSGVADLAVPLDVDWASGPTWFDAQKH